jgi:hypothetical protein
MNRAIRVVTLTSLALVLTGCTRAGTAGAASTPTTGSDLGTGTQPATVVAVAIATGARSVIYAVPAADKHSDGTLYLHVVGADWATDVSLGQGTDAVAIPAVGSPDAVAHMQWYISATSKVSLERPAESMTSVADPGVPFTSLEMNGVRYFQVGDVVVAVKDGATTATYPLPVLDPDSSAGDFPAGYKGLYSGVSTGTVSALLANDSGDVLAFTFTGRAAAVTDLMTQKVTPIAGYSRLGAGVRDAAGRIELLAWKAQDESQSMRILVLDPTSLAVQTTLDLGASPANHLRDTILPGVGHDAVLAVATGDETIGVSLSIWTIDGAQLSSQAAPPLNSGLSIAPADGSSVYVYDGPGANRVGQLDLASNTFKPDVANLRAPSGSYVVGILP